MHVKRHVHATGEPADELLVGLRTLAQPVVHVKGAHRGTETGGDVEESHRVPAARDHHQERLPRSHQAAVPGGGKNALVHSSRRTARHSMRGSAKPFSFTCPISSNLRWGASRSAAVTASLTSTSPPRARATTREVRFTSRPK